MRRPRPVRRHGRAAVAGRTALRRRDDRRDPRRALAADRKLEADIKPRCGCVVQLAAQRQRWRAGAHVMYTSQQLASVLDLHESLLARRAAADDARRLRPPSTTARWRGATRPARSQRARRCGRSPRSARHSWSAGRWVKAGARLATSTCGRRAGATGLCSRRSRCTRPSSSPRGSSRSASPTWST